MTITALQMAAQVLRQALAETPGLTVVEAIDLLDRAAAEQEAVSQRPS